LRADLKLYMMGLRKLSLFYKLFEKRVFRGSLK
jgi:hypothetical protein